MQETNVEIKILKQDVDFPVDPSTVDNVIFAENSNKLTSVSQIVLSGKYNRTYNVLTYFFVPELCRVLVDGDLLIFCTFSELVVVDLNQDKVIKSVDFDCYQLFEIAKFKSGYIIHGEGEIRFLNRAFDVVWEGHCADIFANIIAEKDFEVFEDYVVAIDWNGYKHYYNESGEYKIEYCPKYDPDKNGK